MQLIRDTIGDLLQRNAEKTGNREAVVFCEQNVRHTWKDLNNIVNTVAKGLIAVDVERGDHIAMWGANVPEWLYVQLAAARIGAALITINPEWKQRELEYALAQSDTDVLVMMPGFEKPGKGKAFVYDYLGMIRDICPNINKEGNCPETFPMLRKVILTSEGHADHLLNWDDFLKLAKTVSDRQLAIRIGEVTPQDVSMIQYTSGTTGFPKGAMLTHFSTVNNARAAAEHQRLTPEDRLCGPVPYYHCFGSILFNLACLYSGATIVVPAPHFDSRKTLHAVEKEKCTALYGVPTMFIAELEEPDFGQFDLRTLRTGIIAGAPVDKELFDAVTNKMGAREMTIAYGLTEASPVTHQNSIDDPLEKRMASVGKPIPFTEAKIVNPGTFEDMLPGEVGEIWVKGFHVMQGYYKKPEDTDRAVIDGWLRTGDLGTRDENGYYRIVGRLKELIIVGGHNVYPAEVEQALHTLLEDKVEILQVVGVPHPKLQEMVALVVKCLPGQTLTLDEVRERCEGQLEWPKIPRRLEVIDDFSNFMTVTGKIQKFKLAQMLKEQTASA